MNARAIAGCAAALVALIAPLGSTASALDTSRREPERSAPVILDSVLAPLRLHVPLSITRSQARRWLADLEWAAARAGQLGWPAPWPDGSRGGSPAFDVYVVPGTGESSRAIEELPADSVDLPSSIAYGVVSLSAARVDFASCAVSSYVQGATWRLDPYEDGAWRAATGTFVAAVAVGRLGGCTTGLADLQASPERAWFAQVAGAPDRSDGGALVLLSMSTRHDGGTGRFIRDLWELAGYRSVHGDPDAGLTLFDVWSEAARGAGDSLRENLVDDAIWRAVLEQPWRARLHPAGIALDNVTGASFAREVGWSELPSRLDGPLDGLEPTASWLGTLDTSAAPSDARLRVWFEGELGCEWSVHVIGFDEAGTESVRLAMPVRNEPRGYLVLERVARHHHLVVVVTALPRLTPWAEPDPSWAAHGFRLTLDR